MTSKAKSGVNKPVLLGKYQKNNKISLKYSKALHILCLKHCTVPDTVCVSDGIFDFLQQLPLIRLNLWTETVRSQ